MLGGENGWHGPFHWLARFCRDDRGCQRCPHGRLSVAASLNADRIARQRGLRASAAQSLPAALVALVSGVLNAWNFLLPRQMGA
jgi:hypothetical protein